MRDQDRSGNAAKAVGSGGFLSRLARDARGNTLAIVGAALVPLTAMIGSGVDMSRAYMAKTRLQSACDAAALAARRVMINDTMTTQVAQEGNRFFNFNFRQGLYGTEAFAPVVTRPESGTVRVQASTRIPTAIMHMFGFESLPLNVTCDASLNFVNTDVMLVLDVTGSMDENLSGTKKIVALRDAVMALYDELAPIQNQLEANGLRLRYGVVPYSSAVNVGHLIRNANPDYLADEAPYQTRVARYNNFGTVTLSDNTVTETRTGLTSGQCNQYAVNANYPTMDGQPAPQGTAPEPVTTITYSLRDYRSSDGRCRRYKRTVRTQTGWRSSSWFYRQENLDVSEFKMGDPITIATDDDGVAAEQGPFNLRDASTILGASTTNVTWDGCIEERDTVSSITSSSGYNIPNSAFDLNVNMIPDSDATRWRPHVPQVVYTRSAGTTSASSGNAITGSGSAYHACPTESRRLQAWTRANMQTYVNSLTPIGGTYHDIGMIWGARMLSSGGVFADSPDTFNAMPVSRHIIFMTDGQMAPNCNTYTSYGVEQHDTRVTGGSSCPQQLDRHMQRFRMICNAARGMNMSIWVIAFGTTLTQDMIDCASNPNQASTSSNRDQLIARFREIGNNIGALRLTQ